MVQTISGVTKNMWMRKQSGLYAPARRNFPIDGLALYAPLWHPELSVSPFLSKDLNAHSCTVVGAIWGSTGRTFDGDDNIYKAISNWLSTHLSGSVHFWFKYTNAATMALLASADEGTTLTNVLSFIVRATGDIGVIYWKAGDLNQIRSTIQTLNDGVWHFATVGSNGTSYLIFIDGAQDTVVVVGGADNGDWFGDIPNRDNIVLGARKDGGGLAWYFTGTLGEVAVSSQVPTLAIHNQIRLATRWRYL